MPSQKPERPDTPLLEAARAEQEALAKYEQEVADYERSQRAQAEAKARAERIARQKHCLARCRQYAIEAEEAGHKLVAALENFVAASDLPPNEVSGRVRNFLGAYVRGFGDLTGHRGSGRASDLVFELYGPEVRSDE